MTQFDQQYKREALDHYPTLDAKWAVPALMKHVDFPNKVWEPHCGSFHLVDEMRRLGANVIASDIEFYDREPDMLIDFLGAKRPPEGVRTIVMNPPYENLDAHIEKALAFMDGIGTVCLLARADVPFAQKRAKFFQCPGYMGEIKLAWRLKWVEGSTGQGRHNYSWFIWDGTLGARQFNRVELKVDNERSED